jgi:predicted regulator of Ras-like GTPase activity (Roadblock/LC7/MglB family)
MAAPDIVMYEEEFNQIKTIISKLRVDANSKVVFLVDKNGQQIAAHGEIENLDTTSLASLTAGNVAATDGLARLIGEKEFSILFHEGEKDNIHISIVAQRVILVVIFDERSSLGPMNRGIIHDVSIAGHLHVKLKADRSLSDPFGQLIKEIVRILGLQGSLVQVLGSGVRNDSVASIAAHAILVGEAHRGHTEVGFLRKAGWARLGSLREGKSLGVTRQELLDWGGRGLGGIGGSNRA